MIHPLRANLLLYDPNTMSTIDIGATERPLSRIPSPRTSASPTGTPIAQEIDAGDFYIGSTKINALPPVGAIQSSRHTPAN